MRFSPRLKAILSFVEGRVLVDIGTDHGYIPIAACLQGKVDRAIACDLWPGPLKRATENIKLYGLEDRIITKEGDGLRPLNPDECECVVIAGMGGMNISQILKDAASFAAVQSIKRLIVQPQRDILVVKETLNELGFIITDEAQTQDRNRTYTIILSQPI